MHILHHGRIAGFRSLSPGLRNISGLAYQASFGLDRLEAAAASAPCNLFWHACKGSDSFSWKVRCCWILSCSIIHVVPVGIVFAIVESLQVYAYDGVVWAVCSLLFVLVAQLLLLVLVHCRWRGEKRVCDKRSLYAYRVRFALSAVVRESQQLEATAENVEEESPRSLNFDSAWDVLVACYGLPMKSKLLTQGFVQQLYCRTCSACDCK